MVSVLAVSTARSRSGGHVSSLRRDTQTDMLTLLQARYGPCLDERLPANILVQPCRFHYMLHHCLAKSSEEYDKNAREFLYRIYTNRKGCEVEEGTPEYDIHDKMFDIKVPLDERLILDATMVPGLWKRLPKAKTLPEWLKCEDLEYITREFERAGFHGGLSWYRAMKLNFETMNVMLRRDDGDLNDKITPPSLFIMGENDGLVNMYGGKNQIIRRLHENMVAVTREPNFVPNVGHWVQVEGKDAVNKALLQFLADIKASSPRRSRL